MQIHRMREDEYMDEEPHQRTNTCRIDERWIFFCDEITEYEHKGIKYDSIWPEFHTLKPILHHCTSEPSFQVMLYRLPEIRKEKHANNIKMSGGNMAFFESEFFPKYFVIVVFQFPA